MSVPVRLLKVAVLRVFSPMRLGTNVKLFASHDLMTWSHWPLQRYSYKSSPHQNIFCFASFWILCSKKWKFQELQIHFYEIRIQKTKNLECTMYYVTIRKKLSSICRCISKKGFRMHMWNVHGHNKMLHV